VEINASPNLLMFLKPAVGTVRPVGEAIIDMLFPDGGNGRIPTFGITGTRGKTSCVRLLAHLLRQTGATVSVASSNGVQIGPRTAATPDGDRIAGAQGVLLHPWTEIAVCEAGAQQILSDGLGFDRCSVGVVLNVGDDHLGHAHTDSIDQMAVAKRCIVDVVLPTGTTVLNADDPLVAEMAAACRGTVIYFTTDHEHPVAAKHSASGGRVVDLREGTLFLTAGQHSQALCALAEMTIPDGYQVHAANVLAAVGAAWAYGLSPAQLATGLRSFASA